jgi:hypothetical protein
MVKQFVIAFAAVALSVASAETYRVNLAQPAVVKGTELKAGDYHFNVKDNTVVIARGKQKVEVPVKVDTADKKFPGTRILYGTENGKYFIREIELGGTRTKLLFGSDVQAGGGE